MEKRFAGIEELDDHQRKYRSAIRGMNWLATNSRPDLSFEVMTLSCKFRKATTKDFNRARRLQARAKEQPLKLKFQRLELNQLTVVVYGDAAHASLDDGVSSEGGKIVFW